MSNFHSLDMNFSSEIDIGLNKMEEKMDKKLSIVFDYFVSRLVEIKGFSAENAKQYVELYFLIQEKNRKGDVANLTNKDLAIARMVASVT